MGGSSSVPHLSISVAEDVSELIIEMRSVLVQVMPAEVVAVALGGMGGGGPSGGRGGISEARRRASAEAGRAPDAGMVARAKSE